MAVSSASMSLASTTFSNRGNTTSSNKSTAFSPTSIVSCSKNTVRDEERNSKRRSVLIGSGVLALSLLSTSSVFAEEMPKNYDAFVDSSDGYSYYYPSDWREFDFRGHDSAFKDRYLQLQNVRLSFIPTEKKDIHDLGPIDEVVYRLVNHVYSAPTQYATIYDMQERTKEGKSYYTFEYTLTSPNFSRSAFATIAIGNGRYYTLIVGANERRWKKVRNQLKVVADSFRVLDI